MQINTDENKLNIILDYNHMKGDVYTVRRDGNMLEISQANMVDAVKFQTQAHLVS